MSALPVSIAASHRADVVCVLPSTLDYEVGTEQEGEVIETHLHNSSCLFCKIDHQPYLVLEP